MKREVRGGGGITPDIFFNASPDTLPEKVRELALSPKQLFFTFVEAYLQTKAKVPRDFNLFLRDYQPDSACMKQFVQYVKSQHFPLSKDEYIDYQQDIRHILKQTMAESLWGEVERYKIQMLRDRQLMEAVGHFDAAKLLLAQSYGYTVGVNSHR